MSNEIKKALEAGYEAATPPSPGEVVEEVNPNIPSKAASEVVAEVVTPEITAEVNPPKAETVEEPKAEVTVEVSSVEEAKPVEEVKPEVKFADNLFKPFSLGSTLKQGASGNVMTNVKKPALNYEAEYKRSIKNIKLTAEEIAKLHEKKSK